MLLPRDQKKAIHSLLPSNRWPEREAEQHNGSILQSIHQLGARRLVEFAYNNVKNASTGHTPFKLNCGYYPRVSFKEDADSRSRSRSANKLAKKLRELIEVCCQNLLHVQELQKRAHDKGVKSRSYAPGEKVWLNSKYIKMKRNKKLESKFIGLFRILHVVRKQAYKLELPTK